MFEVCKINDVFNFSKDDITKVKTTLITEIYKLFDSSGNFIGIQQIRSFEIKKKNPEKKNIKKIEIKEDEEIVI